MVSLTTLYRAIKRSRAEFDSIRPDCTFSRMVYADLVNSMIREYEERGGSRSVLDFFVYLSEEEVF